MSVDGQAGAESFAAFWQDLDRERQTRGWTRDRLARRASQLSQQPLAEKTLHDRMAQGRRVPWDQAMWIVRALELDEPSWKRRWEHANNNANNNRHQDRSSPPSTPEPSTPPNHFGPTADAALAPSSAKSMPARSPLWRSRFASAASGFVAGAAVMLIIVWATGMNGLTNNRTQPDVCALVSPPTADVFIIPDDPKPMFAKQRGDRITLPSDLPTTMAANGYRYRYVHTLRAPSGYAFMREDALTPVPC